MPTKTREVFVYNKKTNTLFIKMRYAGIPKWEFLMGTYAWTEMKGCRAKLIRIGIAVDHHRRMVAAGLYPESREWLNIMRQTVDQLDPISGNALREALT